MKNQVLKRLNQLPNLENKYINRIHFVTNIILVSCNFFY